MAKNKFDIRDRRIGLTGYLNYCAFVEEGVMIQKDGSFLTGFMYVGPDLDSAMPEDVNRLAYAVNDAFTALGDNYVVHINAIRRDASGYPERGFFPDRTTWLIDEERRLLSSELGTQFESIYAITLAWLPPSESSERAENWLFEDSGAKLTAKKLMDTRLEDFKSRVSDFFNRMSGADVSVKPMTSQDLLTFLHSCLTGLPHPVRVPKGMRPWVNRFMDDAANETLPPPMLGFLDTVVASQDFVGGFEPKIGDMYLGVVSLTGLPTETIPGMLDSLNRLQSGYRWNTRFISMNAQSAEKQLAWITRQWLRKQYSIFQTIKGMLFANATPPTPKREVVEKLEQLEDLKAQNSDARVRFGYYNTEIILYNTDREAMKKEIKYLQQTLGGLGFPTKHEKENAVRAFLGSLPGDSYNNVRRTFFASYNLVDLLPLTSVWSGHEINKHLNAPALLHTISNSATPFRLNLHVGDVGHTLVIGPTGWGKSTFLMLIAAQWFRYKGAQVVVFDKGYSAYKLCLGTNGTHYDLLSPNNPSSLAFCPLQYMADSQADMEWSVDFISSLVRLQQEHTTLEFGPAQMSEIRRALEVLKSTPQRSLSAFYNVVQDTNVRSALEYYLTKNPETPAILDAESDALSTSKFTVFEMEHLLGMGDRIVVPTVSYLFRVIEKRLTGAPTLIILDEAWALLKHPLFEEKIREWLKVLRKANTSVVFATQDLNDIMESKISSSLLESAPTRILLGNPQANTTGEELYKKLGLNKAEILQISNAPRYSYYYTSPNGKRLFFLRLGPAQSAFVAGAGPENTKKVREMFEKYGDSWPYHYLEETGLKEEAMAWARATQ